jgi:4-carboxymuconolactone decarboxylase
MEAERFSPLDEASLSAEQRRVREAILAGARGAYLGTTRGAMRGPFKALLHSPGLYDAAQRLGEYVRFRTVLPRALSELAILLTGRRWTAQYEWYMHRKLALEAGLSPAIADAIALGERPAAMSEDEAAVHDFAHALLWRGGVSDAQFAAVRERFGEAGVADLVGTLGYYSLISMVLNVDRTQVPDDAVLLKPAKSEGDDVRHHGGHAGSDHDRRHAVRKKQRPRT